MFYYYIICKTCKISGYSKTWIKGYLFYKKIRSYNSELFFIICKATSLRYIDDMQASVYIVRLVKVDNWDSNPKPFNVYPIVSYHQKECYCPSILMPSIIRINIVHISYVGLNFNANGHVDTPHRSKNLPVMISTKLVSKTTRSHLLPFKIRQLNTVVFWLLVQSFLSLHSWRRTIDHRCRLFQRRRQLDLGVPSNKDRPLSCDERKGYVGKSACMSERRTIEQSEVRRIITRDANK